MLLTKELVLLFYSEISTVKFILCRNCNILLYHGYQPLDLRSSVCIVGIVKNVKNCICLSHSISDIDKYNELEYSLK